MLRSVVRRSRSVAGPGGSSRRTCPATVREFRAAVELPVNTFPRAHRCAALRTGWNIFVVFETVEGAFGPFAVPELFGWAQRLTPERNNDRLAIRYITLPAYARSLAYVKGGRMSLVAQVHH